MSGSERRRQHGATSDIVEFLEPGSAIGVAAQLTPENVLEFSVDDHGPGIPAENRQRIFAPFFREELAKHSNMPGHGLGLAICRSIVLAHRGHITVADRAGGGTRFRVLIPVSVEAKQITPSDQRGARTPHDCVQSCTADADADLSEHHLADLVKCIRLCLDCADVCATTASVITRQTEFDSNAVAPLLAACATMCKISGDECERHAHLHEHCRLCAEASRRCEQACRQLLDSLMPG